MLYSERSISRKLKLNVSRIILFGISAWSRFYTIVLDYPGNESRWRMLDFPQGMILGKKRLDSGVARQTEHYDREMA